MKTADLIPLILIELAGGDKYGFELTKAIEDKSNQQIQIKQPTLYTVLKKLEKSKFISSYWEDSEIGGKRHYYKITENGKAQIATLPSFEQCIQNILLEEQEDELLESSSLSNNENIIEQQTEQAIEQPYQSKLERFNASFNNNGDIAENNFATTVEGQSIKEDTSFNQQIVEQSQQLDNNTITQQEQVKQEVSKNDDKFVSIMDLIADNAEQEQTDVKHSVVNPTELFENDSIDHKTELEVNKSNSALLKNQETQQAEQFAENKQISKFVDKVPAPQPTVPDVKSLESEPIKLEPKQTNADYAYDDIKYVDYVNFKTKKEYIYAKKVANLSLLKTFAVSIYALIMMIICGVAVKGHASSFYYCFFIATIAYTLCYLAIGIKTNENLRLKTQKSEYKPNFKIRLIINGIVTLIVIVLSIISSVLIGNNTISSMFSSINFANIYAPILLCTIIWIDTLLTYIVAKTTTKSEPITNKNK